MNTLLKSNPDIQSKPSSAGKPKKQEKRRKREKLAAHLKPTETPPPPPNAVVKTKPSIPNPSKPVSMQSDKTSMQQKMMAKLQGGRFRYINEQLYTTTGRHAFELFQTEPTLFDEYHRGFREQVEKWPQNPLDTYIQEALGKLRSLMQKPSSSSDVFTLIDMGCGEAQLARSVYTHPEYQRSEVERRFKILSLDLVARNAFITAANIAETGLPSASADWVLFCLSLMGVDCDRFLAEAHRLLKPNGVLKIAEVKSRFEDEKAFIATVTELGFKLKQHRTDNKMFVMFEFIKTAKSGGKRKRDADEKPLLKPCIYKRR